MASSAEVAVWRLVRPRYAPGLDGEGARLAGGRWNPRGRAAVYAASSLALAVLEIFVHLPAGQRTAAGMPLFRAIRLTLPENAVETASGVDPADPDAAGRFGGVWLEEARSLALRVPSAVVPPETNLVLNPLHPRMAELRIIEDLPFRFDPRLSIPAA